MEKASIWTELLLLLRTGLAGRLSGFPHVPSLSCKRSTFTHHWKSTGSIGRTGCFDMQSEGKLRSALPWILRDATSFGSPWAFE